MGNENLVVFEHPEWLSKSSDYVKALRTSGANATLAPEPYVASLAAFIAATIQLHGKARILDFGGGIGPVAAPVLALLPADIPVEYVVLDGPMNCEIGRALFAGDARATFTTTIPDGEFDILAMCGALQYIQDWRGVLQTILGRGPSWFYLSRIPVREGDTIAPRQPLHLPAFIGDAWHWVFGPELEDLITSCGYAKAFDAYIRDLTGEVAQAEPSLGRADMRCMAFRRL